MKKHLWLAILIVLTMVSAGCTNKNFLVSSGDYRDTVKTLGVLPLLVDAGSDIIHPDRETIIQLIRASNLDKISYLVQKLSEGKVYFDVRQVEGHVEDLFDNLVKGRELVARPDSFYRSYHVHADYVGELSRKNMVDGILVVILNGVVAPRKHWDRTRINFLETEFNMIIESALVVAADGRLLWEYSGDPSSPFLALQYPDFDEAHYNKTNKVKLKFITLSGLERALQEPSSTFPVHDPFPKAYRDMLNRVEKRLRPGW